MAKMSVLVKLMYYVILLSQLGFYIFIQWQHWLQVSYKQQMTT